jgi:MFS family permease
MGLIGTAHGCSHFFQLVLPPLFPFLITDFDLNYTQLGVLMTTFFVASGIGQPIAGFLVDRFGAREILLTGLAIYVIGIAGLAVFASYLWFFPVMLVAAMGNCVFHPADFTILNASIHPSRLGRAFGIHTMGGNLGWALAPVLMLVIAEALHWRAALLTAAGIGALVWLTVWFNRHRLRSEPHGDAGGQTAAHTPIGAAVLFSAPVLLCFGYFLLLAAALIAVQNFLPPILDGLHGTPLVLAATALTGFLIGASAGVLCGGFVADRSDSHATVIVGGLLGSAVLIVVVAEFALLDAVLIAAIALAGFLSGVTTPSRDMLVRSATPKGATGRVFGFVYSGLDVGSALAPVTVGWMLDHGEPRWALWLVAVLLFAAIFTTVMVRTTITPRQPAAAG